MPPRAIFGATVLNPPPGSAPVSLTPQGAEPILRIVIDALAVQSHYHLFLWLHGELKDFLPHQMMLSASGNFSTWALKLDIVSALPSVNPRQLAYDNIDSLIEMAHTQWAKGDRRPVSLGVKELRAALPDNTAPLRRALRDMASTFLHGVCDFRGGNDSLYILQDRSPQDDAASARFLGFLDLLIPQIDAAFRRVPPRALHIRGGRGGGGGNHDGTWNLSQRELQVLELLCQGVANMDIAAALEIGPFTVKNHLQRIFSEIGVHNRTQAATRYSGVSKKLPRLWA